MNKILDLYRYLKMSGFSRELEILKTALETTPEELEETFPQLFRFYEEGKPTAMFGGVFAQINKYIEEGYISQQEVDSIQDFNSLKQKMKELKNIKKETEAKFKYLNEYDIEQEFKDLTKENNLSKEDFEFAHKSFIAEDEDNHQLEQAIAEIADLREKYRLLKEKINTIEDNEDLLSRLADPLSYKTLNGASTEINNLMMDVNNIIEGRQSGELKKKLLNYYNYIYNGENKLNADYPEERRGKAKETSKVLYNDGNWAIVTSWSEEACQYWERGAVRVEGDKVGFNTCTSRIRGVHGLTNENMYSSYSGYTMFQILKLENGEPKFYEGPNEILTLCFEFKDNNFQMIEGASASVNADDKNLTNEMVAEILPENIYTVLMKILNGKDNTSLLSPEKFFSLRNGGLVPEDTFNSFVKEKAKGLNPDNFFRFKHNIPEDVFNSFVEEKARGLHPDNFFGFKHNIPEDVFNSLIREKAKGLHPNSFFAFKKNIPEDIFNSLLREKLKGLHPYKFFSYDNIPEDIFDSLAEEKAKRLYPNSFFEFKKNIPEGIFNSLAEEKAKELEPNNFFIFLVRRLIPEDIFNSLVREKAKELEANNFFRFKKIIPEDVFNSLVREKAMGLDLNSFYEFKKIIPEDIFNSLVIEEIKNLDPERFFLLTDGGLISHDIFNSFVEEKAKGLEPYKFFKFKNKGLIPEDIFNSLVREKAKGLEPYKFFSYDNIPEDIFNSLVREKVKELYPDEFFSLRDRDLMFDDVFDSFVEEKAKESISNGFKYYDPYLDREVFLEENAIRFFTGYLNPKDFFEYSDKIPKDIFNSIAEQKAKELNPDDFFKYRRKIPRLIFRSLVGEKAKEASPEVIFERGNIRALIKSPSLSKEDLKDLIISKEKELPSDVKFSYAVISPIRKIVPQEVFKDIFRRRYEVDGSI